MIGKELTDEALRQINTVKQDDYGKPEDCFGSIARRWTEYLQNNFPGVCKPLFALSGWDVAFMIMELKMARESNKSKKDNMVDLIGYACLKEEMQNATD